MIEYSCKLEKINHRGLMMKNIVFIGDSITDGGTYPSIVEAFAIAGGILEYDFINLGVSSENTSGLTEEGHPFPRPNILNRIDRITSLVEGEWATVMYGENDGIYQPFSQERFELYKKGITEVVEKLHKAGFKVALITPTPFDPVSFTGSLSCEEQVPFGSVCADYDKVMEIYANWILSCGLADKVIDVRTPLKAYLDLRRKDRPNFKTGDGIHQGEEGNYIIASQVLKSLFGIDIGTYNETPLPYIYKYVKKKSGYTHRFYKEFIGHENPYKEKKISQSKFISKKKKYIDKISEALEAGKR